jgi:hypothetical protein
LPSSGGWGEPPPGDPVLEPGDSPDHPLAPWFAHFRERRREHHAAAAPGPPRRSAVLTIAQNESVFLPIWLRYYSRFFGPEDIHVLDHGSTDGSTDAGGFVRIPVSHPTFDNEWMVATVEEHQRRLLESYDVVLVVDTDEIVAPNPGHGTLADYLARFSEEWVNCLGYELVHKPDEEPPFRPELPVLRQRGYWFHNVVYDKPAIATVPLSWRPGFHRRADYGFNLDPDLRLIHLHRMDYEICKARHRRWTERTWNPRDVAEGWGVHNRVVEDEEFDRWFRDVDAERIPETWLDLV